MIKCYSSPPYIHCHRVKQTRQQTTPDPHFAALAQRSQSSADISHQYTSNSIPTQPAQQNEHVANGNNIKWVNCQLLPPSARKGYLRVYKLESVKWFTFMQIRAPNTAVTLLYWGRVDALHTFLDLTRPCVYLHFYNWVGESVLWSETSQFCIKREGIAMTVCGLPCILIVTDEVLQVGFLGKDTVDDWMVGGVYKVCSGAKNAWVRKGSVNKGVPMEESIATVRGFVGPVPACPSGHYSSLFSSTVSIIDYILCSLLCIMYLRLAFRCLR